MVGFGHELIDVLGPAELQPVERGENGILVTNNILWEPRVWVHIRIISIYHMCGGVVGRHCNTDCILAIPIYNDQTVITFRSYGELYDFREGQKVHANVCTGGLSNAQGLQIAISLLCGLFNYQLYGACLAVCERIFLHIWTVEMASQSMIGLVGGSITKEGIDRVQNQILNLEVAFLCIGDT